MRVNPSFPNLVLLHLQGSVAQLQEVWEETDGLDPKEFNPKTFFKLHGERDLLHHVFTSQR